MKSVFKYELNVIDEQTVLLPEGAEILSVQFQDDQHWSNRLFIWALVDDAVSVPKFERAIRIHGTGHPVSPNLNLRFIDTVQTAGGQLVFHVFEVVA